MALAVEIARLNAVSATVALAGTLTLGTNLRIAEATIQDLVASGASRLVLDLTACSYADSAGLGFLMHTSGKIAELGGTLRLCGVGIRIAELLRMTRTDSLLLIDPDRETSLRHL